MKIYQGNIIQEERRFFFIGDRDLVQIATIIFEFHNDIGLKNTGEWKFKTCTFGTQSNPYNLEDWDFLVAVGNKIQELNKTLNK